MSVRPRTQHERLAAYLLAHRPGLTAVDCVRQPTFDGGPPVMRPASRMAQVRAMLDAKGYDLVVDGRGNRCAVYRAVRRVPAQPEAAAVVPDVAEALFQPPPAQPSGPYEVWGDEL